VEVDSSSVEEVVKGSFLLRGGKKEVLANT